VIRYRQFGLIVFCWLLMPVLFSSCKEKQKISASRYNDLIVDEVQRATSRMTTFYSTTDGAESLNALNSFLEASKDRISNLDSYRDDASLRDEGLKILDFYSGLCADKNQKLVDLTNGEYYSREDSVQTIRVLTDIVKESNRMNKSFTEIQERFAQEHGLLLVK
jgi:hypothetical protein